MKKLKAAAALLCITAIGLLGEVRFAGSQNLSVASMTQQDLQMLQIDSREENADTADTAVTTESGSDDRDNDRGSLNHQGNQNEGNLQTAAPVAVKMQERRSVTSEMIPTMAQTTTETRTTTGKDATTTAESVTETQPVTSSETAPVTSVTAAAETEPELPVTESAAPVSVSYWEPESLSSEAEPAAPEQEAVNTPAAETPSTGGYAVSVTPREYMMLVNVVSHEYGAEWVPTAEKAKVAEVIMNRVNSPQFPNTVYEVLTQKGQFTGIEYYIELETYSHLVTDDVIAAVDLYLTHPEQFQHGYLFFNGDGRWNYFRCQY